MADSHGGDEELDRVLKWLKDNGVSLLVGAVLGVAIIGGWQWWQARIDSRAYAAARLYGDVVQQINQDGIGDGVRATVQSLKSEYSGSPYAANAAFRLAARAIEQRQYDQALAQLDWVIGHSGSEPTRQLARVRKARVLWAAGRTDDALKVLQAEHPESFDRLYAELRGDIYAALGQRAKAHEAYQRAAATADAGLGQTVLQRKLAQTAPPEAQQSVTTSARTQSADEGA